VLVGTCAPVDLFFLPLCLGASLVGWGGGVQCSGGVVWWGFGKYREGSVVPRRGVVGVPGGGKGDCETIDIHNHSQSTLLEGR